ncbi:Gfo/Idh/MocA family oxidoreductase [Neomegalonema sp.]|uniref:Gfo/Idh/MocA family protein n=1 Tax=Neomegalonema sp. TaxID=2039713 RepID=UPI002637352D|nr:Gfo/Idh/MocA family oxidoreductase [Neomegalonema sp.]MDD2868659.1 Gfo/Idh/MocA family oxidoreductase [Neomegalonema sp.]
MRLLILGTGGMANTHAEHFAAIPGLEMVAAVDRDPARVEAFAAKHGVERRFLSLEEALAWGEFDAAANVTPDGAHHATTMALIRAGKHVFCEKPLATDAAKAFEMAEAAEAAGLINMVNFTYRNVPQLQEARRRVLAGEIGAVKHIEASYLQSWLVSKAWGDWKTESQWLWRLSKSHGSNGVLGDVGVHIFDFAVHGAGADVSRAFARLLTFDKAPGGRIGEYPLDANDSFVMTAQFANGAAGVIHATRWATGHSNDLRLRIYGDKGALEVNHSNKEGSGLRGCLGADTEGFVWRDLEAPKTPTTYEGFVEAVRTGVNGEPDFRHAARIQQIVDLAARTEETRKEAEV